MYKHVWIERFKTGIDRHASRNRLIQAPRSLGQRVPGIERYVLNHARDPLHAVGIGEGRPGFDVYACCWFASRETFQEARRTPEWSSLRESASNLFDREWSRGMSAAVEEATIVDGDAGPFKAVWIVRFKDAIRASPERVADAHEYWIQTHGRHFGRRVPGIGRYVQNHAVKAAGADETGTTEPRFDGFSECWFNDRDSYEMAMASPEWAEMNGDALNLFDLGFVLDQGMSALLDEDVVKG